MALRQLMGIESPVPKVVEEIDANNFTLMGRMRNFGERVIRNHQLRKSDEIFSLARKAKVTGARLPEGFEFVVSGHRLECTVPLPQTVEEVAGGVAGHAKVFMQRDRITDGVTEIGGTVQFCDEGAVPYEETFSLSDREPNLHLSGRCLREIRASLQD